ncbi:MULTISPECIES: hypothetical protein [Brevibacillus]|uniref:Uncharacterized protein n=1 Tax=Brevibacillus borstelensis AK1 TaxID=1300222 RepID=M8D885_9BACL|nr:hypothetical protein [Brevibacillus borstelensis]EMT52479.1 hypothetical protein I532_12519 [Brevibacillus borstelensis AK1]MCC0565856.1 hypothetical protein [Brevibacillus borstelensis]MCM3469109.1 hypothetical protein [Brevibacillus borstelensis]MCM3559878.1 hypothetical protein [Brevibacillus borstelensis]MCM3590371.1 hypothetical protein [Brevibacillus borstelensis]
MDIREMVASITKEILQSMNQEKKPPAPRVLYVFCDSQAHEAFADHFIQLKNHGICHDILFLDGETSSWLGMHKIECGGAGKILTADEYAPIPLEVPKEYAGIVIPEIDLDNAARVANGLKGTIKAELVFSALVTGKFVLVGSDVPGIKRADRRTLATLTLPPAYEKLFHRHVQEMKELGVEFAEQKRLADKVIAKLNAGKKKEEAAPGQPVLTALDETEAVFSGRLLTADWIRSQPQLRNTTLYVKQGSIVSPLAYDSLRERGVTVSYLGKG